jgi:hypothetical protein
MERRAVLKLVALGALSPNLNALQTIAACEMKTAAATSSAPEYQLRFFTEQESRLLDQLMEMIIPADNHSPGAHAAKTNLFADLMVSTGKEEVKKHWRDGLRLIHEQATATSLDGALRKAASNEGNPQTDLDRFFILLKQMTVNGYYTSSIGIHQDLNYVGNTYLLEFPECTDPEQHQNRS